MQFELLANNMALLEMIAIILVILLMLWGVFTSTGRNRTLSLLGFLVALSFLAAVLVITSLRMDIITETDYVNWGVYVVFGMRGIIYFLIVTYVTIWAFPDFFSERKWAVIVALIGPIVYEILMFSNYNISTIYGPALWFTMLVLALLYMAVIPLMATIQRTRQDDIRGSPQVKWIWVVLLGLLFWFFGEAVLSLYHFLQLPGYASLGDVGEVMLVSAQTISWYLILVGFVFQRRTSQADTS